MRENDLDLDVLENADDETVRRIAESYEAVTERDMKRLFSRSEQMFMDKNDNHGNETDVSGVEKYRRPVWHKALAFASALVLIAGAGAGGTFLLRNKSVSHETAADSLSSVSDIVVSIDAATDESASADVTAESTSDDVTVEPTSAVKAMEGENESSAYLMLQLHELPVHTASLEEADVLVAENSFTMSWDSRYGVDTDHYAALFMDENYDINSLEAKSYLYHMAMNSVLYFDTAQGTFCEESTTDQTSSTETSFRVDLNTQESYARVLNENTGVAFEEFIYDDQVFRTNPENKSYSTAFCFSIDTFNYTADNYRHIDIDPPDYGLSVSGNYNVGGMAGKNLCAEPLAISRLVDFDKWQVNGMTEYLGRTAAEISGTLSSGNEFTMIVDINTGIVLDYSEYSAGKLTDHQYFTELETDVPVDRVTFVKPDGYSVVTLPFYNDPNTAGEMVVEEIPVDDEGTAYFLKKQQ